MLIGHCSLPRLEALTIAPGPSLHRIALTRNCPGLFQERLSDVRNGRGEQLRLLFLGSTKNKVHETFGHSPCHVSHVDRLVALNVLINEVIDLAVQAALRCTLVRCHDLTFAHHVSFLSRSPPISHPALSPDHTSHPRSASASAQSPSLSSRA